MNPFALIDLNELLHELEARADKDELRIRLFFAAVMKKGAELAHDPNTTQATAEAFVKDLGDLGEEYIDDAERLGNPKKWSLGSLFGHGDPFKGGRENVRSFAQKWSLDPVFVAAMG